MDVQRYYDDFSRRYELARGRGYHALIDDIEAELVADVLGGGGRVLEVGCGTGLILERLAPQVEALVGLDLSRQMLSSARGRGLSVVQGDATGLPFSDGSFDLACSFKVLAHVPAIRSALAEMARVVRPGGALVAEFYNPLSLRYLAKRLAGPRQTGERVDESDVTTRWDPPWRLKSYLPPQVELVELRGVRVVTPVAAALELPVVGGVLERLERRVTASGRAAALGGFVVMVGRRS